MNTTKTHSNIRKECFTLSASIVTLCKCAATPYQLRAALEKQVEVQHITLSDWV